MLSSDMVIFYVTDYLSASRYGRSIRRTRVALAQVLM